MDDTTTPIQPTEPIRQPQPVQKKKSGKNIAMWVLTLLVLALAGIAYWQYSMANQAKTDKESATTRSATLQNKVSNLEGQLKTAASTQTTTTTTQSTTSAQKTDTEMITSVVTTYVHGQKGNANAKITVNIDKKQLPFARAMVNGDAGFGFACVLKKVDDTWIQLYCAQGVSDYTQSQDEIYEVPSSIIQS